MTAPLPARAWRGMSRLGMSGHGMSRLGMSCHGIGRHSLRGQP